MEQMHYRDSGSELNREDESVHKKVDQLQICPECGEPVRASLGSHRCGEWQEGIDRVGRETSMGQYLSKILAESKSMWSSKREGQQSFSTELKYDKPKNELNEKKISSGKGWR
jgi:hypothetical protein